MLDMPLYVFISDEGEPAAKERRANYSNNTVDSGMIESPCPLGMDNNKDTCSDEHQTAGVEFHPVGNPPAEADYQCECRSAQCDCCAPCRLRSVVIAKLPDHYVQPKGNRQQADHVEEDNLPPARVERESFEHLLNISFAVHFLVVSQIPWQNFS